MKTVILLAFVAFASAVPYQYSLEAVERPFDGQISGDYTWLKDYFGQGNTIQVPQYIAYQFHYFQQLRYTPAQVSQYFSQHGYPSYAVQYLTQQYEAGFNKSYFQSPYLMYQYYHQQTIPQELKEYIREQINIYFQQFQKYNVTYGLPRAFEQEYSVPKPFSEYMGQQMRFYSQKGINFEQTFQYLESAFQYGENIMQYFIRGTIPKDGYVFEHLQYAFENLQQARQVYQPYMMSKQNVPYYVFQNYLQYLQKAFFYFQNVYQYIGTEKAALPDLFVSQIQHVYFAIQKVLEMYKSVNLFNEYYKPSDIESYQFGKKQWNYKDYPVMRQEPMYNWYGKYMNKDRYFDNQKYGYRYGSYNYDQKYGYPYGSFDNYDQKYGYPYGSFDNYDQKYGYRYGSYNYDQKYGYLYGSSDNHDQKYGYRYGSSDNYNNYKYGPYSSSYYPYETSQYRWGYEPSYPKGYQYYGQNFVY